MIIRNLDKDLGKNGDYSGKFRGANMAKQFKARKFLSIIALFSFIAIQPQPIQAGFWSWITWPFYALFDSDKDTEQTELPTTITRKTKPQKQSSTVTTPPQKSTSWLGTIKTRFRSLLTQSWLARWFKPSNGPAFTSSPRTESDSNNNFQAQNNQPSSPQDDPKRPHIEKWFEEITPPVEYPIASRQQPETPRIQPVQPSPTIDDPQIPESPIKNLDTNPAHNPDTQEFIEVIRPESSDHTVSKQTIPQDEYPVAASHRSSDQGDVVLTQPNQATQEIQDFSNNRSSNYPHNNDDNDSLFDGASEKSSSEQHVGQGDTSFTSDQGGSSFVEVIQDDTNPILDARRTFVLYPTQLEEHCNTYAKDNNLNNLELLANTKRSIEKGAEYAYQILTGQFSIPENENELIPIVKDLIWYFYSEHLGQTDNGIGFEEGTFIVPKEFKPIFEKAGYNRISSHAKHLNPGQNKGIDCSDLPQGKRHVLLVPFSEQSALRDYLLIKPENHGVSGITNIAGHAWEFLLAQTRKTSIGKAMGMMPDDAQGFCKERIPQDVIKQYNELLQICGKQNSKYYQEAAKEGIFTIYQRVKTLLNSEEIKEQGKPEDRKKISEFLESLETTYDNLDMRIGKEVILRKEDLLLSAELYRLAKEQKTHPLLETGLTLIQLKKDLKEHRSASQEDSQLLAIIKSQLTAISTINPKKLTQHPSLREYLENIKTVSGKALSNDAEFLKHWARKPFPLEFSKLRIDAHRIRTEERFSQFNRSTITAMNQFESTIHNVLEKQKEFVLSELGNIEQNYDATRKRCRSAQAVIEPLIQQLFSKEDTCINRETWELFHLLKRVTNESTGLGKVVEFRQILHAGFGEAKNRFSALCKQITCTALALHKKRETQKAKSLCTSVIKMFDQCINSIRITAKKCGLSILEPKALKLKALQLQRIAGQQITQNGQKDIAESAETTIESFEHQLGFFGDPEERDQYLEAWYDASEKTIKELQAMSPISTAPNSTAPKQIDAAALLSDLGTILQSVTQPNPSHAIQSEPSNSSTTSNITNTEQQILGKEIKIILKELLSGILAIDQIETIKLPQTISAEQLNTILNGIVETLHARGFYTTRHPKLLAVQSKYNRILARIKREKIKQYQEIIANENLSLSSLFNHDQTTPSKQLLPESLSQSLDKAITDMEQCLTGYKDRLIANRRLDSIVGQLEKDLQNFEQIFSNNSSGQTHPSIQELVDDSEWHQIDLSHEQ